MAGERRNIFEELVEGIEAIGKHREGKLTLRTHKIPHKPVPDVDSDFVRATRESLRMSQGVFADLLGINRRTLERWEQGGKPNRQGAVLVRLVRKYPDTIGRIQTLSEGNAARRSKRKVRKVSGAKVVRGSERKKSRS